jgi:tetratricopeptide (TPR) repeat protein
MRAYVTAIAAALALGLCSASAATDSEILMDIGMLGAWAQDCRLPPGPTNPHMLVAAAPTGEVTLLTRNGFQEATGTIRDVQALSQNRFRWSFSLRGIRYDAVFERIGERYRGIETVGRDGKVHVRNGYMTDFGRGTARLEKCLGSTSDFRVTAAAFASAWQDCSQGKDTDRAIKGCTQLLGMQPDATLAYQYRGLAYSRSGKTDLGIADLTEAIRLDPQYVEAYNNRAWTYFESGKAAQGLPDIQRALELQPENAGCIDTRAHIYEALGRKQEAVADFRNALVLTPTIKTSLDGLKRLGAAP